MMDVIDVNALPLTCWCGVGSRPLWSHNLSRPGMGMPLKNGLIPGCAWGKPLAGFSPLDPLHMRVQGSPTCYRVFANILAMAYSGVQGDAGQCFATTHRQ